MLGNTAEAEDIAHEKCVVLHIDGRSVLASYGDLDGVYCVAFCRGSGDAGSSEAAADDDFDARCHCPCCDAVREARIQTADLIALHDGQPTLPPKLRDALLFDGAGDLTQDEISIGMADSGRNLSRPRPRRQTGLREKLSQT